VAAVAGSARLAALLALFAAGTATGAGAAFTTAELAGRYTHSFRNGLVSGESFTTTDTLVIVPTDARHAMFDINLNFFNGHVCSLSGIARLEGQRLVYREAARLPEDPPCVLRFWRQGARLRWTADNNSCRTYCGARGSFTDGGMAWSSRRPLSRATRARLLREFEENRLNP
jgi:hypothetical protein